MTTYNRSDRRHWRYQLRKFAWRITQALATLVLLVVLLPAAPASARSCPASYPIRITHGCRTVGGSGVACDSGYEGRFRKVNGYWIGRCAPGPIVIGGQP